LWTDLYQILWVGSYGEREDQVRVSLRSVEGCGSNGQKNSVKCKQSPVKQQPNSRCGKCCQVLATKHPNFAFAGSCTLSEYFPSGCNCDHKHLSAANFGSVHCDWGLGKQCLM